MTQAGSVLETSRLSQAGFRSYGEPVRSGVSVGTAVCAIAAPAPSATATSSVFETLRFISRLDRVERSRFPAFSTADHAVSGAASGQAPSHEQGVLMIVRCV